jgi:hypothetical protein
MATIDMATEHTARVVEQALWRHAADVIGEGFEEEIRFLRDSEDAPADLSELDDKLATLNQIREAVRRLRAARVTGSRCRLASALSPISLAGAGRRSKKAACSGTFRVPSATR